MNILEARGVTQIYTVGEQHIGVLEQVSFTVSAGAASTASNAVIPMTWFMVLIHHTRGPRDRQSGPVPQ